MIKSGHFYFGETGHFYFGTTLFCSFLFLWLCVFLKRSFRFPDPDTFTELRVSFLVTCLIWSSILVAGTETLSLFNAVGYYQLCLLWAAVCAAAVVYIAGLRIRKHISRDFSFPALTPFRIFFLLGVICILSTILFLALYCPPNNDDALMYHMARVVHWIQNQNVGHYPTSDSRQLYQPPFAEFVIMHFQILSGSDYFANFVQWFCLVGSLVGISLIAQELGADLDTQLVCVILGATIPMAVLQGSSTQNDLAASFSVVSFVYLLLYMRYRGTLSHISAAGASLGIALLTKGTSYIFAVPFMFYFVLSGFRDKKTYMKAAMIIAIAAALNSGHYYRN